MVESNKYEDHDRKSKIKGRKTSAIIHLVFLGLLAFPFLQSPIAAPVEHTVKVLMDFSTGSSAEGAIAKTKDPSTTPKAVQVSKRPKSEPIKTTVSDVEIKETKKEETEIAETKDPEKKEKEGSKVLDTSEPETTSGQGKGTASDGTNEDGSAVNGSGKGFIEGSGVLTRAVIDRGNTKELAQMDGTLVLKICINRRGMVTFAEWDKEASSIKESSVARTALDNVLNYRFEKDRTAPSKECGRLTYIIDVS